MTLTPMNAKSLKGNKYHKVMNDPKFSFCQEKMKGIRAFIFVDGPEGTFQVLTRNGKDITPNFPHFQFLVTPKTLNLLFDCEIFAPGLDDAEISGLCMRKWDPDGCKILQPWIFDIPSLNLPQIERWRVVQAFQKTLKFPVPQTKFCECEKDKLKFFDEVVSRGGEGIMIKHLHKPYKFGKRPEGVWYKLKYQDTADVIITGAIDGHGKFEDLIGALCYAQYNKKGELVNLGTVSGFDDSLRKEMSENFQNFRGRVIEIKHIGRTKNGCFEHPSFIRFRDDKDPKDCVMDL